MPAVHAKLLTIVTVFEAQEAVADKLAKLGAQGFTLVKVQGHGVHGTKSEGVFESGNVQFTVVCKAHVAASALTWVEDDLAKHYPSIAYTADVSAIPGGHFG